MDNAPRLHPASRLVRNRTNRQVETFASACGVVLQRITRQTAMNAQRSQRRA